MSEMMRGPVKPKFKLGTNWKEQMYLVYGTWYAPIGIALPYFYGPPITGLEFCFVSQNKEPEDFIQETFSGLLSMLPFNDNKPNA